MRALKRKRQARARPALSEYTLKTWAYLAALDVHREHRSGKAPFDRLVEQVMTCPPYNDARRVFWIVDKSRSRRKMLKTSTFLP